MASKKKARNGWDFDMENVTQWMGWGYDQLDLKS